MGADWSDFPTSGVSANTPKNILLPGRCLPLSTTLEAPG